MKRYRVWLKRGKSEKDRGQRSITDSSRLSGVPQQRSGLMSPCPVCCRLPFSGVEMRAVLDAGVGPGLLGAAATTAATEGSTGAMTLAGNQPTPRVLWFWPRHSLNSRLYREIYLFLKTKPEQKPKTSVD